MEDSSSKKCPICSIISRLKCSRCSLVFYCSKEHQAQHWEQHRPKCLPISVKRSTSLYPKREVLVAKSDIEEGQVIFVSKPCILFPRLPSCHEGAMYSGGKAYTIKRTCVGCCKYLLEGQGSNCSKCRLPVCGAGCENDPFHRQLECAALAKFSGVSVQQHLFDEEDPIHYNNLIILRCLLAKNVFPETWAQLSSLPVLGGGRKGMLTNEIQIDKAALGQMIQKIFLKANDDDKIDGAMVKKFQALIAKFGTIDSRRATCCSVDVMKKRLPHACLFNAMSSHTRRTTDSEAGLIDLLEKRYTAVRAIKKGEVLTLPIAEINSIEGTVRRREALLVPLEFSIRCKCDWCKDPTELGTFLSALRCTFCGQKENGGDGGGGGDSEPAAAAAAAYVLSSNPLESDCPWYCTICSDRKTTEEVQDTVRTIRSFIKGARDQLISNMNQKFRQACLLTQPLFLGRGPLSALDNVALRRGSEALLKDIQGFKEEICEAGKLLHPNHFIIISAWDDYLGTLYFYLSMNRAEPIVSKTLCFGALINVLDPKIQLILAPLPANWIQLHQELVDKAQELMEVVLKLLPETSLVSGRLFFYTAFGKLIILKHNAKFKKINYQEFLKELNVFNHYKEKAELSYRELVRFDSEEPRYNFIADSLEKMDQMSPKLHAPEVLFARLMLESVDGF